MWYCWDNPFILVFFGVFKRIFFLNSVNKLVSDLNAPAVMTPAVRWWGGGSRSGKTTFKPPVYSCSSLRLTVITSRSGEYMHSVWNMYELVFFKTKYRCISKIFRKGKNVGWSFELWISQSEWFSHEWITDSFLDYYCSFSLQLSLIFFFYGCHVIWTLWKGQHQKHLAVIWPGCKVSIQSFTLEVGKTRLQKALPDQNNSSLF